MKTGVKAKAIQSRRVISFVMILYPFAHHQNTEISEISKTKRLPARKAATSTLRRDLRNGEGLLARMGHQRNQHAFPVLDDMSNDIYDLKLEQLSWEDGSTKQTFSWGHFLGHWGGPFCLGLVDHMK